MRKTALSLALAGALLLPAAASAYGYMEIHLQLPEILQPVVVIQPGVQVIPQIDQEVFVVDRVYYARHNGGWYRAPEPHAGAWTYVHPDAVPASLVKIPPGKYKNWKPTKAEKDEAKAQKKAAKKAAKQQPGN
jgi:hypothetical protein